MKLTVSGIEFSYNSHPILEMITFRVHTGEMLGVLGMNGAGKSTLLKCMNRILEFKAGSVLLDNEDLNRLSRRQVARRLGYVPQRHPGDWLTVYEAVLLGRRPRMGWTPSRADYQCVESILERMEISHLASRPLECLSGGEAQKAVIARALAQEPGALLLDEPTSSLDLKNQMDVMGQIRRIVTANGLSAVVSIHDLNLALRFADRFLFLKDHRVFAAAGREQVTAEVIEAVYGIPVDIHDIGGRRIVIPR